LRLRRSDDFAGVGVEAARRPLASKADVRADEAAELVEFGDSIGHQVQFFARDI
jgi:hypothetical protein